MTASRRQPHLCPRCSVRHYPACAAPRWPLEPLLAGVINAAETFSVATSRLALYAEEGLPDHVADRWAVRIGRHPAEVWPEWFDVGLSIVDAAFVDGGWRPAWLARSDDAGDEVAA